MCSLVLQVSTVLGLIHSAAPLAAKEPAAKFAELRPGMTAEEVSRHLNNQKPERVIRQIIYRRHIEQWLYEDGSVRLQFDCRPSEEPRLNAVVQIAKQ